METDGVSGNRTENDSKKIRHPDTPISDLKYYRTIWNFVKNKTFERTPSDERGYGIRRAVFRRLLPGTISDIL